MRLNGTQRQKLSEALRRAFDRAQLEMLLDYYLDKNLEDISLGTNLQEVVFRLIERAESEGWTMKLLSSARLYNPGNTELQLFAQEFGLAPKLAGPEMERLVTGMAFNDIVVWRQRLGELEYRICKIMIRMSDGSITSGTGFLVKKDVLLTNYHVLDCVINREEYRRQGKPWAKPDDVVFLFDYKALSDGFSINAGTRYYLSRDEWLIDYSPMSIADNYPEPKTDLPAEDELDYALVRLDGDPGLSPIGNIHTPGSSQRGWIHWPSTMPEIVPSSPILIVQHPKAEPLKIALDIVLGENNNSTRITYRTNTEPGSSGSPCFNSQLDLIAIHHSGDPDFSFDHHPTYNEGIPIDAIDRLLRSRGLGDLLDSE